MSSTSLKCDGPILLVISTPSEPARTTKSCDIEGHPRNRSGATISEKYVIGVAGSLVVETPEVALAGGHQATLPVIITSNILFASHCCVREQEFNAQLHGY